MYSAFATPSVEEPGVIAEESWPADRDDRLRPAAWLDGYQHKERIEMRTLGSSCCDKRGLYFVSYAPNPLHERSDGMQTINTMFIIRILTTAIAASLVFGGATMAQTGSEIPPSLVTPDTVESNIGTLEYKDGVPTVETAKKVREPAFQRPISVSRRTHPAESGCVPWVDVTEASLKARPMSRSVTEGNDSNHACVGHGCVARPASTD